MPTGWTQTPTVIHSIPIVKPAVGCTIGCAVVIITPGPCRRTVGLGPGGVAAGIWDTVTVPVSAHAKVASCPALLIYLNGVINISIGIGNG